MTKDNHRTPEDRLLVSLGFDHPSLNDLLKYVQDPTKAAWVEDHLEACPQCAGKLWLAKLKAISHRRFQKAKSQAFREVAEEVLNEAWNRAIDKAMGDEKMLHKSPQEIMPIVIDEMWEESQRETR